LDRNLRIAVLADTHIPKRARTLPLRAWEIVRSADAIIHAGDVLTREFLRELETAAPLYAVRGNNDVDLAELPEILEIELESVKMAVIHDSGAKDGRATRMRKRFPLADVIIFGHSHIPMDETEAGLRLFNPGSPTDRRRQPHCSMGLLHVANGKCETEIVQL
jgi:putative phosphoesterase